MPVRWKAAPGLTSSTPRQDYFCCRVAFLRLATRLNDISTKSGSRIVAIRHGKAFRETLDCVLVQKRMVL